MKNYPKWLYGYETDPILVMSEEEHDELKGQWFESPADVFDKKVIIEKEIEEEVVKRRGRPPRKIED